MNRLSAVGALSVFIANPRKIHRVFKPFLTTLPLMGFVATCPFCGRAKVRLTGALSKGGKVRGVATNVYLWKTSEKPKETSQNENSKFGSCIYA